MTFVAPLWRYFVADLDGNGITDYSKLAADRVCEVLLNGPLSLSGTVPSDNPQVNIAYTDGYPYLSEGNRLLWGFRRENDLNAGTFGSVYSVRAATIVQLVEDVAEQDDARTRFTGWDPWHYMFSRPCVDIDGNFPGAAGLSWNDTKVSVIVCELLRNTILNHGHAYIDAGDGSRSGEGSQYQDWEGTVLYGGTLDPTPVIDWNVAQNTSVGQAWQDLCAAAECDIVLTPIYDTARPNMLVEMNVVVQAGVTNDTAIFSWDLPGRSLVGLDRQQDGSVRANKFAGFAGQGGSVGAAPVQEDLASVAVYGEYWGQQFWPAANDPGGIAAVTSLAAQQVALRANGRQTVTFRPAPERSPRPWVDYGLGDRVPVWASSSKFRQLLDGSPELGSFLTQTEYQRIYGWRASIDDNALETVEVLTSPQGFSG